MPKLSDPQWTDVAAVYIAGGAFVVALAALVVSWLGLSHQRTAAEAAELSAEEAKRSADAAVRAAESGDRSARAAERSALASEQLTEIEAIRDMRPTIMWELERLSKERVQLRNTGTETATGVTVAPVENILVDPPHDVTIQPGASVPFGYVVGGLQVAPRQLSVTCNELAEPISVEVPAW
ncbi:hypothetical protein [Microbispora sp. H10949]|uniref:hypothetical protein n=1 Tax=Microbispora sp. H10949 TaxID=2729111 RepID=UPI001603C9AA|nr:hypothetical protein [Microbispora sp. H10949]